MASIMKLPEQTPIDAQELQTTEPSVPKQKRAKRWITVRELCVFSMLGALMFCSKLLMEGLPNLHLLDLFIISFTLVYRTKALIPIYLFVLLTGVFNGFNLWLVPYLYVWLFPFALTMLLPRRLPKALAAACYLLIGTVHGLLFGVLYAPVQALIFHLNFEGMLAWIAAGFYFDLLHAIGNLVACTLVVPLTALLLKLEKRGTLS